MLNNSFHLRMEFHSLAHKTLVRACFKYVNAFLHLRDRFFVFSDFAKRRRISEPECGLPQKFLSFPHTIHTRTPAQAENWKLKFSLFATTQKEELFTFGLTSSASAEGEWEGSVGQSAREMLGSLDPLARRQRQKAQREEKNLLEMKTGFSLGEFL